MKLYQLSIIAVAGVLLSACAGLLQPSHTIVGTWEMVSGGIKDKGVFTSLEKVDGKVYKTIEFRDDGTFTEVCEGLTASGTYSFNSTGIKYSYSSVPEGGPAYFAIHKSGLWTYMFWEDDFVTLYDFSSPTYEVSMSFRLKN